PLREMRFPSLLLSLDPGCAKARPARCAQQPLGHNIRPLSGDSARCYARQTTPATAERGDRMASQVEATPEAMGSSELQERAKRHLWMHFSRMGSYADHVLPVIVRGEGCYVYDEHGKRYLDGLS